MATMQGKSFTVNRYTASLKRSGKATSSLLVMALPYRAPAPPMAAKYTACSLGMAAHTSSLRSPLPIIPFRPSPKRRGANESMRALVVGPQLPHALPAGAGQGPA